MNDLDQILPDVLTQDTRRRQNAHAQLVSLLQDEHASVACQEMDKLVDGLAGWIASSNFKISLCGLEVTSLLIDRLAENFKPHVTSVLPSAIDRLGDAKDPVRESAQEVILKLMCPASSPQYVFDRSANAFTHKLSRVKEEVLVILQRALNIYGSRSLKLNTLVPAIVKLLEDGNGPVRDEAVRALVEIYRHVGDKVRNDILKKNIQAQKMSILVARMDEVKNSGQMVVEDQDDTDFARPVAIPKQSTKRVNSASSSSMLRKSSFAGSSNSIGKSSGAPSRLQPPSTAGSRRSTSQPRASSQNRGAAAGAVDEEAFIQSFEDVPKIHAFSARDVQDHMKKIRDVLGDPGKDWQKRCEALKLIRSLLIAGGHNYDDFYTHLRSIEAPVQLCVKDLRSQIVREACLSIAYASQELGLKFDHFAECVLPGLIGQLANSAKIMATSASVAITFMLRNTHSPRLVPIILSNLASKNNVIRRVCMELLTMVLELWGTHSLEKHIAALQDTIKKGMSDPDAEARATTRKAYWGFNSHFPSQAASLLDSLDGQKQKLLQGEVSNSSSNSSLGGSMTGSVTSGASRVKSAPAAKTRTRSHDRTEMLYGTCSTTRARRAMVPASKTSHTLDNTDSAARVTSSASRSAGRGQSQGQPRVSHSQPSSRSNSPSSRYSQISYSVGKPKRSPVPRSQGASRETSPNRGARRSAIPRSQGASRDSSPNRNTYGRRQPGLTMGALRLHQQATQGGREVLAQRVLVQGSDAEQALAEALHKTPRKRYDNYESDENGSETSSVCSERSFSNYSRATEDVQEILSNLSSGMWSERKEGLVQLKLLLRSGRTLNMAELTKVKEVFTRMFHDPHGKVFSIFLETLPDLLRTHRLELHDWLSTCIQRLLLKMSSDMLTSVQTKVQRALEAVQEAFTHDHLFSCLTKFIMDSSTINIKVKLAVLHVLNRLLAAMEPHDFRNTVETRLTVSRLTTWTTEPKSVDVRRASQAAIIAMFNLNTPEFSMLLAEIPKTFQDGATKILHNHVRTNSSDQEPLTPRNMATPQRYRPSPNRPSRHQSAEEVENINPDDLQQSFKSLQADIQSLARMDSQHDGPELKKERDTTSQDSGIQGSLQDVRGDSNHQQQNAGLYNPTHYSDVNTYNPAAFTNELDLEHYSEEMPSAELIPDILCELSNHNERQKERKKAMGQLILLIRHNKIDVWEEHFNTILLLLLDTIGGDSDKAVRAQALDVLQELLHSQPARFTNYAELTVLKIVEAHQHPELQVSLASEDCAVILAQAIVPAKSIKVLMPIISNAEYPSSMAAIKVLNTVVKETTASALLPHLDEIAVPLVKRFYDRRVDVRKATVFCLVEFYRVVGEEALGPYLRGLEPHQMKLLHFYIKRGTAKPGDSSATSNHHSTAASDTASPTNQ